MVPPCMDPLNERFVVAEPMVPPILFTGFACTIRPNCPDVAGPVIVPLLFVNTPSTVMVEEQVRLFVPVVVVKL